MRPRPVEHSQVLNSFRTRDRDQTGMATCTTTKAAVAVKVLAIGKAVRVLGALGIPYTQPLVGKLVIEPPPGFR